MSEIYGYDFSGSSTILVSSGIPQIVAEDVVQQLANGIVFSIDLLVYQYNGLNNIVPFTGHKICVNDKYCFKVSNDTRRSIIKLIREKCWETRTFRENVLDEVKPIPPIPKPSPKQMYGGICVGGISVGYNSGSSVVTGSYNVAIGVSAPISSVIASYNISPDVSPEADINEPNDNLETSLRVCDSASATVSYSASPSLSVPDNFGFISSSGSHKDLITSEKRLVL
ncbi:MAG: hypothetical protein WD512_18150 [Candidatus Paceibacterota bacterium]